jgi:hypothetical protein
MTGDRRRVKRLRRHGRVAQFAKMWTTIKITTAQTSNRDAGLQLCTMAKLAKTHRPHETGRGRSAQKARREVVLANWTKRCGAECAKERSDRD